MSAQSPIDPNQFAGRGVNDSGDWRASYANKPPIGAAPSPVVPFVASPNSPMLPANPNGTMGPQQNPTAANSPVNLNGDPALATLPWMSGQNLPNGNQAPYANPVGSQDGINANWAYLTSTQYNPNTNKNLQSTYEEQLRQFAANGGKRWVGTVDNGHWDTTPPPPPIFTSTDYNENLAWTNANTPGQPGYAQADASFLNPYLNNDPIYAGTLTPWSTSNTNLAKVYETALPQDGKVPTVTNPNGWLPTEQGYSANETRPGDLQSEFVPRTTPYTGPESTPTQYIGGPPGQPPAGTPNPTNPAQGGLGGDITSIADLLMGLMNLGGGGGGQQNASPFYNNNRSLFYPNTNKGTMASPISPTQQNHGTYGGINMAQLLTALLGGGK